MFARRINFCKEILNLLWRNIFLAGKLRVSDDGVHRGADVVAHVREECCLGLVRPPLTDSLFLKGFLALFEAGEHAEHDSKRHHNHQELNDCVFLQFVKDELKIVGKERFFRLFVLVGQHYTDFPHFRGV